jgi:hypothetical protein
MKKIANILDVFKLFGTNVQLSKILNVSPSGVSEMKRRKRIPVEYWPTLVRAASTPKAKEANDLTMERLAIISAKDARKKAKAAAAANKEVAA